MDKIDLIILKNIQKEGRITNVELAKKAGISAPPCLRRLHNLENSGVIVGYNSEIDPKALGFSLLSFCEVKLNSQNQATIQEFEAKLKKLHYVRESYIVTGEADFLLKIIAKDFATYQNFLYNELSSIPEVSQIKTLMVIKTSKKEPLIPFNQTSKKDQQEQFLAVNAL
ncbi:MAG: ArsR family transcriptional regulator [Candidatus Puniceispirillum sp.]|nr:ArsR family transcriptional regulator [Candidatus Pelagibacter sp.]MBA4283367.1 ArsR family transcriptional regulator [Candidatus Puniceispirillum sp.]